MKVTDYIVEYLIQKGVTDVFGYPGGVICHFIDSLSKYSDKINNHTMYHEQAASFAACGYAQEKNIIGVAYSTSGPGATNLVTGIANAYFDSTPVIFFTGQVDTYALKGELPIRQRGFQEMDVASMVSSITKYAVRVDSPEDIRYELEKAYHLAVSGNPGPVVIDLPADVQRAEVERDSLKDYRVENNHIDYEIIVDLINCELKASKKPCFLLGNGVKQTGMRESVVELIEKIKIPVVTSMPAFDILEYENPYNMGFVGANGHRYANFVLGKADLIISLGSRMDLKQVGNKRENFANNAKLIRIDIDRDNQKYKVRDDEQQIICDIKELIPKMSEHLEEATDERKEWLLSCVELKKELDGYDMVDYTSRLKCFGKSIPKNVTMTFDVGQSEVWLAQYLEIKRGQHVHMSGGHGAMGYSLPAAIGSYYADNRMVFSFSGDGGIQMNIQELQFIAREQIPVKIVVINNRSLGMIRGFQEANFNGNYSQTIEGKGYLAPDFQKIAYAYDLRYRLIEDNEMISDIEWDNKPEIVEIAIDNVTHLVPNFGTTEYIQDQRPYMDRDLYDKLMGL
ncbi:MAG: thiamine pyrophosphate-binding protein [Lachnospiraceae bacterium]|nr:thiamine pyrophosphate-binding protein [Lachnospiraceae bacterium]